MRLAGKRIWAQRKTAQTALAVLRRAVELGVSLDHVGRATSIRDDLLFARWHLRLGFELK